MRIVSNMSLSAVGWALLLFAGVTAAGGNPVPLATARGPQTGATRAFERAIQLTRDGKHLSAIHLFDRALRQEPALDEQCLIRLAYAECLYAATFGAVDRLGVPGPQQSVSAGRISLLKAAVAQLDTAERIAGDPRLVARIRFRHGLMLEVWGFPLDAYGWYRAAVNMDEDCAEAQVGLLRTRALMVGGAQ